MNKYEHKKEEFGLLLLQLIEEQINNGNLEDAETLSYILRCVQEPEPEVKIYYIPEGYNIKQIEAENYIIAASTENTEGEPNDAKWSTLY